MRLTPKNKKLAVGVACAIAASTLIACDVENVTNNPRVAPEPSTWSAQQKLQLLSLSIRHLPSIAEDASNRYQQHPQAVALGAKLFFDKRLSQSGTISCSVCHQPNREFSDGLRVASGLKKGRRNTPSLLGVSHQKWFFWDGRKDSVWSQALEPFEDKTEHDLSRTKLIKIVLSDPDYKALYDKVFDEVIDTDVLSSWANNASPKRDLESLKAWKALSIDDRQQINRAFSNLGKAIAAYEATLSYKVSRFDRYLDDLKAAKPSTQLSDSEIAGLKLFIGKAHCTTCHFSALLSNQHFQNIGTGTRGKDMGRSRVAETQAWDIFNCLGEFSDAPKAYCNDLMYMSKDRHGLSGSFKVPSLRNVVNTAPYLHDGRFKTLKQVVDFYVNPPSKRRSGNHLPIIKLNHAEQAQLVEFLKTL